MPGGDLAQLRRLRGARRLRDLRWGQRLFVLLVLLLLSAFVVVPLAALVHGALTVGNEIMRLLLFS